MDDLITDNYIALLNDFDISGAVLGRLLGCFGSLAVIRSQDPGMLASLGLTKSQVRALLNPGLRPRPGKARDELYAWIEQPGNGLMPFEAPDYPERLRRIPVPPPLLYLRGGRSALAPHAMAVVGSRRCSGYGKRNAFWMACELAARGLSICSGLARGIDGQAHRGALQGGGPTLAVLATGLDQVYPAEHGELAAQIMENGLLLSEFPLGAPPRKENFPRRNRIISGLSLGVLVVEAGQRSGSLITARQALEQNRDVFVIPGSIHSAQSKGCHWLIRQGAALVETPMEILEDYVHLLPALTKTGAGENPPDESVAGLNKNQRRILRAIGNEQCLLDFLLNETGLPMAELTGELLNLELEGVITARGGRYFRADR